MNLIDYIGEGVSPYHVVDISRKWLKQEGFKELSIEEEWQLEKGKGYYVKPYDSVIFAFRPVDETVRIVTGHVDQPMLKVKPNPIMDREGNYVVNVEGYGGMILHTWFDRPLGLAGKVVCKSEDVFAPNTFLYCSEEPVAVIPSLAIHMDREVNKKNELKCQVNLLPLCGIKQDTDNKQEADFLLYNVAEQLDIDVEDILDYDLYFYNPEKPQSVGLSKELLVSPRLDNLTSCYSALYGIVEQIPAHTAVAALFDNEEIGSRSKQGADSSLFAFVLEKLLASMNQSSICDYVAREHLTKNGFIMSMDVAHAYHPNYGDKSDITTKTKLGGGVVLKTSGSQRYNSDSVSNAVMLQLCDKADIPCQRQINHSDIPGGSTLGPIVSSYIPIYGADMGVPVLAMHSAMETAAFSDCYALDKLVLAFFSM